MMVMTMMMMMMMMIIQGQGMIAGEQNDTFIDKYTIACQGYSIACQGYTIACQGYYDSTTNQPS